MGGPVHLLPADQAAAVLPVCLRPDLVAAPGRIGDEPEDATPLRHGPCLGGTGRGAGQERRRKVACWKRTPPATPGPGSAARARRPRTVAGRSTKPWRLSGYDRKTVEDEGKLAALARKSDSKTEALVHWIKKNLFVNGKLRDDERLIVFTEYKETLFYLEQRLLQEGFDKNTLRLLYGGMNARRLRGGQVRVRRPHRRRAAAAGHRCRLGRHQHAGVLPLGHPLRHSVVAVEAPATQRACVPPRPGPGCQHPLLPLRQEEDMAFLFKVAQKVEQVRQDLGSVERVFDAAIQRHFQGQKTLVQQISLLVDEEINRSPEKTELVPLQVSILG